MLIGDVDIFGERRDVRLSAGRVSEIAPRLAGPVDIEGQGRALLPGLHDHHIHLNASAAAMMSVRCGPPEVNTEADLVAALNQPGTGWLRGVGYHASVAGEIDRAWLDANGPDRPVRLQHRGGRLWVLNSQAMDVLNLTAPQDGRLVDGDKLIRQYAKFPDLNPLIQTLHNYGITGVTEVTPSNGRAEFDHYVNTAQPLNLSLMGQAELANIDDGRVGPLKLHYHDYDLPSLEALVTEIKAAHAAGRAIASHCVTRAELMLTLAALEEAGAMAGDRIEHGAIVDAPALDWMIKLGVTLVTQPFFLTARQKAYRTDVPPDDHPNLWRIGGLKRAGVPLAGGSDSPFETANPWVAMAAAVNRPQGFGIDEAITPEEALDLYLKPAEAAHGKPRRIEVGGPADLCLLDRSWAKARINLADVKVQATWVAGESV